MAQAFACTVHLSRRGLFTWNEWVDVFSTEIKTHPQQSGEAANAAYYRQWLAALETMVGLKGAASTTEITDRQETWRQAYLNTPHGQPVELHHAGASTAATAHHHHHQDRHQHAAPKPVSVSPAQR
jgi:nitrile hydratase accessory protein